MIAAAFSNHDQILYAIMGGIIITSAVGITTEIIHQFRRRGSS